MFIPLYYSFRCTQSFSNTYLGVVTSLTIMCVILFLVPSLSTEYYRNIRIAIFVAFAVSGVIPICHLYYQYGFSYDFLNDSMLRVYIMYGIYGFGAIFYITRIPERLVAYKFDIFFHSHQFWHVFVFSASLYHFHSSYLLSVDSLARSCINGLLF